MASEIKIGDLLFDREGKPTKVLGVYPQGEKEVYEITFGDGRKAKCCSEHLWQVHKNTWKNKNDFRPLSLKEILEDNLIDKSRSAKYSIPVAKAVEYEEKEYSIHPYVIGAMLGDGCCISNTRLTLSSENDEIPNHILELLNGQELYNNPANYNWQLKDKNGKYFLTEILPEEVKQLSYEKRIPKEYKYGSINQRLELVQGLMDTDGSISKDPRHDHSATASISFTSTSILLIKDLQEVLGSLGYISTIKTDERIGKYTRDKCYSLSINMPNKDKHKLFWLKRKKEIALSVQDKKQSRNYDRTSIRKIENLNYKTEMVCFMVDNPEHLYLMNDFIVTHNTRVLTERIRILIEEKGIPSKDIVAITFTNMAAEEMRKRIGDSAKEAFIGTIHSYGNKICNYNGIDTSNYLETFQFDKILKRAIQIPKSKYPKIKHLLIDECQDLSPLEYQFLMKIPTENIFFVGDGRQAIYGFKGCTDEFLENMWKDEAYKKYYLTENYRNAPNIIKFADNLLLSMKQFSPAAIPMKTKMGLIVGDVNEPILFEDALEDLEDSKNWGSWFILTRTNNELAVAQNVLDERGIPNVTFKKADLDMVELEILMSVNRVKVLTIHSAKGLENKNVIVCGARRYNEEERRISYVAATRAENSLYWCAPIAKRNHKHHYLPTSAEGGKFFDKTAQEMLSFED